MVFSRGLKRSWCTKGLRGGGPRSRLPATQHPRPRLLSFMAGKGREERERGKEKSEGAARRPLLRRRRRQAAAAGSGGGSLPARRRPPPSWGPRMRPARRLQLLGRRRFPRRLGGLRGGGGMRRGRAFSSPRAAALSDGYAPHRDLPPPGTELRPPQPLGGIGGQRPRSSRGAQAEGLHLGRTRYPLAPCVWCCGCGKALCWAPRDRVSENGKKGIRAIPLRRRRFFHAGSNGTRER